MWSGSHPALLPKASTWAPLLKALSVPPHPMLPQPLPGFCLPPLSNYTLDISYPRGLPWPLQNHLPIQLVFLSPSPICFLHLYLHNYQNAYLFHVLHMDWQTMANELNLAYGLLLKGSWDKNKFYSFKDWKKIGQEKYATETTCGLWGLRYLLSGSSLKVCCWPLVLPTVSSLRARTLPILFTAVSGKPYKVPDT